MLDSNFHRDGSGCGRRVLPWRAVFWRLYVEVSLDKVEYETLTDPLCSISEPSCFHDHVAGHQLQRQHCESKHC